MQQCSSYHLKTNLALLFTAAFIVYANLFASFTILPLYVSDSGGSDFQVGINSTFFFIAAVLFRIYFGPFADIKGRKLPLLIGAFVFATSPLLFLVSTGFWTITLARIYQSIGMAAFLSSGSSLIADLAPEGKSGRYIGFYRFVMTLAVITAPATFMYLVNTYNYDFAFIVSFLTGAAAFIMIKFIHAPKIEVSAAHNFITTLQRTVDALKNRSIHPILLGIVLISICYGSVLAFAMIYITQSTQISNPAIYFTYIGITGLAANLLAGYLTDRVDTRRLVWVLVMLLGIGTGVVCLFPTWELSFLMSSILVGLGYFGGSAALITWLVETADNNTRAASLALQESAIDISFGSISLIFGITIGWIGLNNSFAALGIITFVVAAILLAGTARKS